MKRYLLFSVLYFLLGLLISCSDTDNHSKFEQLNPQSFQTQFQNQQGTILDIRTPEEYTEGHITEAKNIDFKSSNFESALDKLDKNESYFVYCKAGVRSSKAAGLMQELGFTKVYLLDGGIDAWKKTGLPVNGE